MLLEIDEEWLNIRIEHVLRPLVVFICQNYVRLVTVKNIKM